MSCRTSALIIAAVAYATLSGCTEGSTAPGSVNELPAFATIGGSVTATSLKVSGGRATAVNDRGTIAGWQEKANALFGAFVWTPATPRGTVGAATALTTLGSEAMAEGINATGHIVGMSRSTSTGVRRAVLWSPLSGGYGAPLDLGTGPGVSGGFAWAISDFQNDSAHVVGSTDYTATEQALAWKVTLAGGAVTHSPGQLLGGLVPGQGSSARAINASGQVVGYANVSAPTGFHNHAVRWTPTGTGWTIQELRPNSLQSVAWGINGQGYIVGQDETRAWVRHPGGTVSLLPTLGGTFSAAYAINDAREIAGYSTTRAGQGRAVLWLPSGAGYVVRDLGKQASGIGFALNEPTGGATELVGTATRTAQATLWTVR
jgi:probable HAF family extracellular repeat protein